MCAYAALGKRNGKYRRASRVVIASVHAEHHASNRHAAAFDAPGVDVGPWQAAGDIVIRWSLAAGGTYTGLKRDWAPFNRIQQEDIVAREGIVWLLKLAKASGVRAFVVANNKAEGCAPLTMRAIAESLTGT